MPVPTDPTVADIVTAGLKEGGVPSPTSTQITEMTADGFQNVKTELWLANTRDDILETTTLILPAKGNGLLTLPTDFDHVERLDLYEGPESNQGTAQAGAAGTLTLASTFSSDESSILGLYLFTISGTGSGQYRQIIAYDDTTKVATVHSNWTVTPNATTVYLIATLQRCLVDSDDCVRVSASGTPETYRLVGTSLEIRPAPDSAYFPVILRYGPNLTRLDESGTVFVKHLRERRALWIQGVKVQAMFRYDDGRAQVENARWMTMLRIYGGHNLSYAQAGVADRRVITWP